jgi:FMN phosphatase YigB (HAD superfamily)
MKEKKLIAFDLFDTCFDLPQANISYKNLFSALGISDRRRELKKILLTSRKSMEEILSEFLPHQNIQFHLSTYHENICNEVDSVRLYPETLSVLSDLKDK